MARMLARMFNPLRRIDADPDVLVCEAHELLKQADQNGGVWTAITALSSQAAAKIELARYLREHRDS
ncbi:hypothetical protein ACIQU4_28130 [Streptomyces sp. NPDC090741]|uniref:hypothetical protein n=1 Tax=Streptomyces sp. NPDC090741 TaxID=3365967 RepID=UPI00381D26DB